MVNSPLVEDFIRGGAELLEGLDAINFPYNAAFWYHGPDSGTWKLVPATPWLDRFGPFRVCQKLSYLLPDDRFDRSLCDVRVVSRHDPLVRLLGEIEDMHAPNSKGRQFPAQTVNFTYIGDAYIYRLEP